MRLKNKSIYALMLSVMMASQNLIIPVSAEENLEEVTISKEEELLSETITSDSEEIDQNQEEIKEEEENVSQPDPEENKTYSFGGGESLSRASSNLNIKSTTLSQNAIGSGIVTAENLNVRSGPSTSYSKLGTLKNGENIEIYARSNGWYRIYYNGQYAYVSSLYVSLNVIEKGIDVSKWNGTIDWNKVKGSGIDYAIIRAGHGTSTVDPMFHTNIKGAIDAGLKVGVYWFSYATSPEKAKIEAQKCLETISPYKNSITYPVFYDFEYESVKYATKQGITITKALASEIVNSFINYTKSQGYDTGIYTNLDFSNNYFTTDLLHNNNMWIAQYGSECTFPKPYMMWQYTESGKVGGISGNVDLNYTCLKSIKYDDSNIGWVNENNKWYYLNSNGDKQTGWIKLNNKWYYLNSSGEMQTGWVNVSNKWYYLNSSGEMQTGWIKLNNEWYYLYSNGQMAVNTTIDGWKIDSNGVAALIK